MQQLGKHHPALVLPLVPELLGSHPYFDTPEPDMDDPGYIGILLFVFNAAENCPTMLPLFPDHTLQHYTYLRDTIPDLIPELQLPGISSPTTCTMENEKSSTENFLQQALSRLSQAQSMDHHAAQELIQITIRDMERISEVGSDLSATAECISMYLQCQLCLSKVMRNQWSSAATLSTQQKALAASMLEKVISLTHHIEYLFLGLTMPDLANVRQARLRAQSIQLLLTSPTEKKGACIHFLQVLNQLQRMLTTNKITADGFTQALLNEMPRLEALEPHVYVTVLQSVLRNHQPSHLQLHSQVCRARARISEPMGSSSDNPLKFTAGLTVAVTLVAMIENVENIQDIRIQLKYPDQQTQIVVPRASDFRQLSRLRHRLTSQVLLSHNIWSEACHVDLSIVLCYNPDKDIYGNKALDHKAECRTVLQLGPPAKVHVSPKPAKR